MNDRTYGETRDCAGCRFWSEMLARVYGEVFGAPLEAMCLGTGIMKGRYTTARQKCDHWKSGHLGAVDDPPNYGEETRAAYAEEERVVP